MEEFVVDGREGATVAQLGSIAAFCTRHLTHLFRAPVSHYSLENCAGVATVRRTRNRSRGSWEMERTPCGSSEKKNWGTVQSSFFFNQCLLFSFHSQAEGVLWVPINTNIGQQSAYIVKVTHPCSVSRAWEVLTWDDVERCCTRDADKFARVANSRLWWSSTLVSVRLNALPFKKTKTNSPQVTHPWQTYERKSMLITQCPPSVSNNHSCQ